MALIRMEEALKANVKNGLTSTTHPLALQEIPEQDSVFIEALRSKKLRECTNAEIDKQLIAGAVKVGLKSEKADRDIFDIAITELRTHHGGLTLNELALAFSMAARLQLDFDPQTYQHFSLLYLNQLINAYKRWSVGVHQRLAPLISSYLEIGKQLDYSPLIYENLTTNEIRCSIQKGYENIRSGILNNPVYVPYEWFDVMVMDEYLAAPSVRSVPNKPVKDLTEEEKKTLKIMQDIVFDFLKNYHHDLYVREV